MLITPLRLSRRLHPTRCLTFSKTRPERKIPHGHSRLLATGARLGQNAPLGTPALTRVVPWGRAHKGTCAALPTFEARLSSFGARCPFEAKPILWIPC